MTLISPHEETRIHTTGLLFCGDFGVLLTTAADRKIFVPTGNISSVRDAPPAAQDD